MLEIEPERALFEITMQNEANYNTIIYQSHSLSGDDFYP